MCLVVHSIDSHQPFGECFCTFSLPIKVSIFDFILKSFCFFMLDSLWSRTENEDKGGKKGPSCHFYFHI